MTNEPTDEMITDMNSTNHANHAKMVNLASAEAHDLTRAIAELCLRVPVAAGPGALTRELTKIAPNLNFREILERGGWYRLGGVVDAQGTHVADDLAAWAETQLNARENDFQELFEDYSESGLRATRLSGKTHYLVAATGHAAADFVQVEIEELQETICHPLFDSEAPPTSLEQLIDHRSSSPTSSTALGTPFYALRRVTDMAAFVIRMREQKPDAQPLHDFLDAWQHSSAGFATQFSNHWIIAVREHLDRYRQPILNATPVAALNGAPPRFESVFGARGLALHSALQRFDRQVGYPMAWFFHMLTTKAVPHAVASAVIEDVQAGFRYLPDRDVQTVRDWLHKPYAV
jgi:hypothetical protein